MKNPMSTRKKIIVMNVSWAGGIVLAVVLNPHFMRYPFWACMAGIVAAYLLLFYLMFGVKPAKEGEKTSVGVSPTVIWCFVLFLLALDWLIGHIHN